MNAMKCFAKIASEGFELNKTPGCYSLCRGFVLFVISQKENLEQRKIKTVVELIVEGQKKKPQHIGKQ